MKSRSSNLTSIVFVMTVVAIFAAVIFLFSPTQKAQVQDEPTRPERRASYSQFATRDAVTRDIRSREIELVRVEIRNSADHKLAVKLGRIVSDYGSYVVIAKKRGANIARSGLETQPIEQTVNLPGAKFDPVKNVPVGTVKSDAAGATLEKGYYIVQFGGIANDAWLDSLRDAGVDILQYVPHNAFFVYADGAAIAKAAAHSRVRWAGSYLPSQKIPADILAASAAAENEKFEMVDGQRALFDVAVWSRADLDSVKAQLASIRDSQVIVESRLPSNYFNLVRVAVPLASVSDLADVADVMTISPYFTPRIEDERSSQIISGNYTNTTTINAPGYNPLAQFGADGTNVTVAVVDDGVSIPGNGGFYITAGNTSNAGGGNVGAAGGHGHINASIIAGDAPFGILDPTGYNYGRGVAPKANILNVAFLNGWSVTDATVCNAIVTTNGVNGVPGYISNNSWGSGSGGAGNPYTARAASFDGLVRDSSTAAGINPLVIVFSAGNSGVSGMTDPKAAKNVITTANSENIRTEFLGTEADNMDDLRGSSSRGPATDGRIKPDITAPGTVITGGRAGTCGSVSSCFDANHAWSTGTSHAAPQIAGAAALFTHSWKNANGGVNPSVALVKAAILNTGQEMNGVNVTTPIPNGNEGWGRINMKLMLNTGVGMKHVNETTHFSNPGENVAFTGTVADATKPIRVALVWSDPPGAANANPALVNNLDLTVTIGANTYRGNVFTGGLSTTGGSADTINNIEMVRLPAGTAAGTPISIQVNATALNGDGILGNADTTDQHFALVAYNYAENVIATRRAPFDYDGDDRTDISIFRSAPGEWWYQRSSNGVVVAGQFGTSTDRIVPGDYTGDQKTDIAFWRPSTGEWFVLRSEDSSYFALPWGANGDIPVPGDYDNDGKTDPAVFRPSNNTWFILKSGGGIDTIPFGTTGDKPVVGDYDGDSKTDIAIYRPSVGQWWYRRSSDAGVAVVTFGVSTDRPVQGFYTNDNKTDIAFWRPASGEWFILRSEDLTFFSVPFGSNGDIPVPGDYDGDDRFDTAVFRPTSSTWFIQRSTAGLLIQGFGLTTDQPTPSAYVP